MPLLAAWLHDLSPFALRITGSFGIRWYGLAYATGFLIAWVLLRWLAARGATYTTRQRAGDAVLYGVAGVVIGGRLGYIIFYHPSLLWEWTSSAPWWGALAINKGGMSYHGGLLGVIVATWFIARFIQREQRARATDFAAPTTPPFAMGKSGAAKSVPQLNRGPWMLHILDTFALLTPPGLFLGRLANFVNGELLGRIAAPPGQPAPWWAVKFPQELLDEHSRWAGVLQDRPPIHTREQWRQAEAIIHGLAPGRTFEEGHGRLLEFIQSGNDTLANQVAPLVSARHPSQLYQAAGEGLLVLIIVWAIAARPRRPGTVSAWFMIAYGAVRIIAEAFWRLPDAMNNAYIYGLTRGQWLSAGMVATGVIGLILIRRRALPHIGGWLRPVPRV
ncbi:MAG: prolipoprotein diacylglyceryl transferase [Phycisphaerales bacterium]